MTDSSDFIKGSIEGHGKLILKVDMDELRATDPHIKHRRDHDELVCPNCKAEKSKQGNHYYSKQKLYIYNSSGVGYCHRCHTVFVPHFEPNPDKVILTIPNFKIELEESFDEIDTIPEMYNGGMDFYRNAPLLSQKVLDFYKVRRSDAVLNHIDELGFRAYNDEEILVPFRWDNSFFYYQISYCHPKGLKYKSPPVKHKPLYILRPGKSTVVLCEGIFDAIACLDLYPDYTIAAALGCTVTPYQVWMLRKLMPSRIIIYLDKTILSMEVMSLLKTYPIADYCQMYYVTVDGEEDPEEYLCRITNKKIVK